MLDITEFLFKGDKSMSMEELLKKSREMSSPSLNQSTIVLGKKPFDWMSGKEKLSYFEDLLKQRMYFSARFLAGSLVESEGVPKALICHRGYNYFNSLSRNGYSLDRIELSHIFKDYSWYQWLNPEERKIWDEQDKKVNKS